MHVQRIGQCAVLQVAQGLGDAGEEPGNAGAAAVQTVKEVCLLQAFNARGVVAAVNRHVVVGTVLPQPVFHLEEALVVLRLGQQVAVQIRVPRRQHKNDRCALRLGVSDEGVERLDLGLAQLVKALHVYAVEAHTGLGGQRADLVLGLIAERYIVQNAAVGPLDRRGLIVGVALDGVKLYRVALVVGDGGLPAVLYVVVYVALEVIGGHIQDLRQELVVQVGVGARVKRGLAAVEHPRVYAPQKNLRGLAVGDHLVVACHVVAHVRAGDAHVEEALDAGVLAVELQNTA